MSNQYPKKTSTAGQVRISENVIRSIAAVAAKEVAGVEDLAPEKNNLLKSVQPVTVSVAGDTVEITVRIILQSGARLQPVAEHVQQDVKENVQNTTGIIVSKVHVIATDIVFD